MGRTRSRPSGGGGVTDRHSERHEDQQHPYAGATRPKRLLRHTDRVDEVLDMRAERQLALKESSWGRALRVAGRDAGFSGAELDSR